MPGENKPVYPWMLARLFRYLTAFLALYAVTAQSFPEPRRNRADVLLSAADAQAIELPDDTATVLELYRQFRASYPNFSPDQFNAWFRESKLLSYSPDYSQVNVPVKYRSMEVSENLVTLLAVSLEDEEAFDELMQSEQIDWSLPQFAATRNMLFINQKVGRIQKIYQWGLANRGVNVFDSKDSDGLRPISWLLSQGKTTSYPVTLEILRKLEQLGIISLEHDLKEDPEFRKDISAVDDFVIVKAFLPKPSDLQYQDIVADILKQAVIKERWNVVAGCLDLPGFNIDRLSPENKAELEAAATEDLKKSLPLYLLSDSYFKGIKLSEDMESNKAAVRQVFSRWWQDRHISLLFKLGADPKVQHLDKVDIISFISRMGSQENLRELLELDRVPWHQPEFSNHRKDLFLSQSLESIVYFHQWNRKHGIKNIFSLPDENGVSVFLNAFYTKYVLSSSATMESLHKRLEVIKAADLIDINEEFGVEPAKLFSLNKLQLVTLIKDRITAQETKFKQHQSVMQALEGGKLAFVKDNFIALKPYLPEPSGSDYQQYIYNLIFEAVDAQKWNVASGLVELPDFDINSQKASHNGQTVLMKLIEAGKLEDAHRLLEQPKLNPYLRDKARKSILHYAAIAEDAELLMKITSRCPFLIGEIDEAGQAAHSYVKDYYSPAMLAAHNKYEIAEVIDSREIANSQLKAALSELGTAFNSDNLIRNLSKFIGGREKASYTKAKQEFNKWWESKQVGQLLKIGANLHIKNENGSLYLLDYVVVYGGIDKLREIVELDAIAWADKKYATLRYLILFENKGSEAVKLLYNWGFNRGFGNIFDLTDEIGNSLLLHFCQFFQEAEVLVHSPSALNWLIELEQAGFISFKQEFGMGAQTFLSLPKEIMESLVKDRAKLIDENQFRMQALDVMPEEVRTALRDDDFSVIKPYFQEAEYKFYQIYAIFTDALVNRKWQIVEGCLSLPEFNLANSAELNKAIAQTYLSNALTVLTSKLPRVRIEDFIIDPDVLKDYKAVFKAWWQEYHIEALLKLKADPILEQKDNLELLAYVSMLGDAEHLAALNSIVELPWDSMAFALYRKIIFASKDFDKAKALYDYGVRKWSSNIFEKSDYAGRNALFSSLYTIYAGLKDDADTKKLYDERFKELEEAGIADFIKLFGGSGVKIATSGPSSIRYQLYIKIPLAFVFNNYYVGLTLVLGNIGIALSMAGYCALDRRPRVPEPVQEEPANHAPERHARRMPPAQVRPAPEDPTARQMNELQTALGQARQLLEHIQIKKADAEQKSKVQGAVPEYAQLLQAYENAIQKHQAFISALSSAIANMNSQNLASLSIAKEQLQTTSESCVQAEALVRRAEEAKIVHEREAELQARRQTAQQESLSKEQKLSEIITKLTQLQGQDIEDLIKLNQMKALLQETQVLGIEMNKLKPKLAPFIKEKERIEAHVMNLVTLLNTEAVGVLALAANYEASLATRMAEIKAWRSKIQEMGAIHPDVKSAFERSTELLLGLSGEGREYYRLLFQYSGDIEHCNKLDMPIRDKLSQVKKSYKKLQELFFQLGLNQSQVELLTEVPVNKIIEDLQKQSDIESGWENFVRLNREYANLFYTVKDLCQRIRQELNPKEMEKQISSGDVNSFLYLKRHQAMAICFNLARLFEQLGIVWPELGDIRHHLVHRYYLSKDNPNLLLDLAELFIDEDTVLKQLHLKLLTRDNSLEDQIKNTEYFKRYCTRSIRYSEELRQPQTLIDEIKDCLKVLQEFVANIDPDKGPDLSADAKGLLSDHARMAVNSLCHDLLGDYRIQLCEYFETRGMNRSGIKNMLQFMESNMVRVLRNKTMHEASVEAAGMVAVKSELDGNALKMISIELKSLRKLLENIPARESLALRTLRADAPEWRPAQTM